MEVADSKALADRIKHRIKDELGTSVYAIEQRSALPEGALRNALRGREPKIDTAKAIADAIGWEFYFGPHRGGGPLPPAPEDDLTYVPQYDVTASAGPGAVPTSDAATGHLAFRTQWLWRQGLQADRLALIDVSGDSMAPELLDGDTVLLDTRASKPRQGLVYVFRDLDDTVRVKRVASAHDALSFVSASAEHPDETRAGPDAERIAIIGRVVWFARTLA